MPRKGRLATRIDEYNALSPRDKRRFIGDWFLDRAMIFIIILLVIYIQIQRPTFLQPASIINILTLTAARLPIALGVAGCIILAGTDLSAGRIVGLSAFVSLYFPSKVRHYRKIFRECRTTTSVPCSTFICANRRTYRSA